jgi:hypothetical protein
MQVPGAHELIKKYQARASVEGVDALGYYMAPWSYAQLQVLQQAIVATESLDDAKLGDHIRTNTFKTVVGDVKFGANGELTQSRLLQVQFQNIKGNDLAQFKDQFQSSVGLQGRIRGHRCGLFRSPPNGQVPNVVSAHYRRRQQFCERVAQFRPVKRLLQHRKDSVIV